MTDNHVLHTSDGITLAFDANPTNGTYGLDVSGDVGETTMGIEVGEINLPCATKNFEALRKVINDESDRERILLADYSRSCVGYDEAGDLRMTLRTLQYSRVHLYLDLEDADSLLSIFQSLINDLKKM